MKKISIIILIIIGAISTSLSGQGCESKKVFNQFFVPFTESETYDVFHKMYPSNEECGCSFPKELEPQDTINKFISIVISKNGTLVTWDHWEDGYEFDLNAPEQETTLIFGDNDISNGIADGYSVDTFSTGDVINLLTSIPIPNDQEEIKYDGKDRFGSTANITATTATWANGSGSLLAGAVILDPTLTLGSSYVIPVGIDNDVNGMFEYVGAFVQAYSDGTRVTIDIDADGITDKSVMLDMGEVYLVNGDLHQGATIVATNPVNVSLVTGDICTNYETRWFTLFSRDQLSNRYVVAVGTEDKAPTFVHLYNPNNFDITVKVETSGDISDEYFDIEARSSAHFKNPNLSGCRATSINNFAVLATVDSATEVDGPNCGAVASNIHDWGYTVFPENMLRQQIIGVPFAPGRDPTYEGASTENSSPVWLTGFFPEGSNSDGDITICVDFNGDGGSKIDFLNNEYDIEIVLDELESVRVYDEDGDQTCMSLWVCDDSDALITAAWGQDPANASKAKPAFDVGTTVINGPAIVITKNGEITQESNDNGLIDVGDKIQYCMCIENSGKLKFKKNKLLFSDNLPEYLEYKLNSTMLHFNGASLILPDETEADSTPFPLDGDGYLFPNILEVGEAFTACFDTDVVSLPPDGEMLCNDGKVKEGGGDVNNSFCLDIECKLALDEIRLDPCSSGYTNAYMTIDWSHAKKDRLLEVIIGEYKDTMSMLGLTKPYTIEVNNLFSSGELENYSLRFIDSDRCSVAGTIQFPDRCGPIFTLDKELIDFQRQSDGSINTNYLLIVANIGDETGQYNLVDNPSFDNDFVIESSSFIKNDGASFELDTDADLWSLANLNSLDSDEQDSFVIRLNLSYDFFDGLTGDDQLFSCSSGIDPSIDGLALFNEAILNYSFIKDFELRDTVCTDLSIFDLALRKKILTPLDELRLGGLVEYEVELVNQGLTAAQDVIVLDHLPCGLQFESNINSGWSINLDGNIEYKHQGTLPIGGTLKIPLSLRLITCTTDIPNYINVVEIINAQAVGNPLLLDVDSTPDTDKLNDKIVDDALTNLNDEDDHDVAIIEIFDLALRKTKISIGNHERGDNIEYAIEILNQGSITASEIVIIDYIPCGFSFDETINPGWAYSNGVAEYTINQDIQGGNREVVTINLKLEECYDEGAYTNIAEIKSAKNTSGETPKDIDSVPDNIPNNDGDIINDVIDNPADEDDHDIEVLPVMDLAIKKTIVSNSAAVFGSTVEFEIEVYNQGNVDVKDVVISDYIPCGFVFSTSNNNGWKLIDNMARYTIEDVLRSRESVTLSINLVLQTCTEEGGYLNIVEILSANDITNKPIFDFDSQVDDIPTNDLVIDDSVDSRLDEDDHDIAFLPVYDVALRKTILTPEPFAKSSDIEFQIEILNQGNNAVKDVLVSDYVPCGLEFDETKNSDWEVNGDFIQYKLNQTINALSSTTINLILTLGRCSEEGAYINSAEISGFLDTSDQVQVDFDSTNDAIPTNDIRVVDDEINNPGITDEDDHDIAIVNHYDLALRIRPIELRYSPGDEIEFIIEVHNQGNLVANNIQIVDYYDMSVLNFDENRNPGWTELVGPFNRSTTRTENDGQLVFTFSEPLIPGAFTYQALYFTISSGTSRVETFNFAEISMFSNSLNAIVSEFDVDSTPNMNIMDDAGAEVNTSSDNQLNGIGIIDEDDHDVAHISICHIMACNNKINFSLDESCSISLTPQTILSNVTLPDNLYTIIIQDENGTVVDNNFDQAEVGNKFFVTISAGDCNVSGCTSEVLIEDKFAPVITCPADMTVNCIALSSVPLPIVTDNCGNTTLILVDETVDNLGGCDINHINRVRRTYKAVDNQGNESGECSYDIYLERIQLNEVLLPSATFQVDLGTAIQCGSGYATDNNGYPATSVTGVPIYRGVSLDSTAVLEMCNGFVSYEDRDLGTVGCVQTISRIWTVGEIHCSQTVSRTGVQMIQIIDNTGPTITCPSDITVSTNKTANICEARVSLPSISAVDNCNNNLQVDIDYPGGFVDNQNGSTVSMTIGTHAVRYIVYDSCGNSSDCTIQVTVLDENKPVAVCKRDVVVSLDSNGVGLLAATALDNGSLDDCGIDRFEIVRTSDNCSLASNLVLGSEVQFCCLDIASQQMVVFRVYDTSGNYNECMANVIVQDEESPIITCPQDMTVACTTVFDINNMDAAFGAASVSDNCATSSMIVQTHTDGRNSCNIGTLIRTFSVDDGQGSVVSCSQNIAFENTSPYTGPTASEWPSNVVLTNTACTLLDLDPSNLPSGMDRPIINEDSCDQVSANYQDEVFSSGLGVESCYQVLRTWTVIDWCNRLADGSIASFEHEQVLEIRNTVGPTITSSTDNVVVETFDTACQSGNIDLVLTSTDDCPNTGNISTSYTIDLNNNGTIDLQGSNNDASGSYAIGIHRIAWLVTDGCGNTTDVSYTFEIRNATTPQAICIQGLSTDLVATDLDNDGIPDTEQAVLSPSFFDGGSSHGCGYDVTLSFSADTSDTIKTFSCNDIGQQGIQLWVTDINGNQDFCATFIVVMDNNNTSICPPSNNLVGISGQIWTADEQPIFGAEVLLESNDSETVVHTQETGLYDFLNMPMGGSYHIVPGKNDEILNGVSTLDLILIQKHVLGVGSLPLGYDRIAADINNSGSITSIDLIELRKVMLGVYDVFPNNESWRFIDKLHEFSDNEDPWDGEFPESYLIDTLAGQMLIDFVGVKIGDVNGSVSSTFNNQENQIEERSDLAEEALILQVDDRKLSSSLSRIRVPLMSKNFKGVEGMQFTLELSGGLELTEIESSSITLNEQNIVLDEQNSDEDTKVYRVSWNDRAGREVHVDREIPLFFFEITTPSNTDLQDNVLSEYFTISSSQLVSEYYRESDVAGSVKLEFMDHIDDQKTLEAVRLPFGVSQNEPNPWTETTTVGIDIPEDGIVFYQLRDMRGQTILSRETLFTAGHHELVFTDEEVQIGSGLIILEVRYGEEQRTMKMIKLR